MVTVTSPQVPAATRLPDWVLRLIFSLNCEFYQVPVFENEFQHLWWRRRKLAEVSSYARVCKAWTGPAQATLVRSVALGNLSRLNKALGGTLLDKYEMEVLSIASRGTKGGKVTGNDVEKVTNKVKGVNALLLKSMTGLTTNAIFVPSLVQNLTHLDLQAAVHLPSKKAKALPCPGLFPLKTLILGSDAQPATFLTQLFTAAAPTLVRLDLYISKTTTPTLTDAFPTIAPSITELSLTGGSASNSVLSSGRSPAEEYEFLALLKDCTRVRKLTWEDDGAHRLGVVLDRFPDKGAGIEALVLGTGGYRYWMGRPSLSVALLLDRPGLCGLRSISVPWHWNGQKEFMAACRDRRVVFE